MEPFDLPTLTGLHLIPGLCDGVLTGVEALAGFPSLQTLPHTATLGHHGVNVHGTESRNKSMVVLIENPYEGLKTEEVGKKMVGERVFVGWPFVTEGMVVSVSDELFRYEKVRVVPGAPERIVANPHAGQGLALWKYKAEKIETVFEEVWCACGCGGGVVACTPVERCVVGFVGSSEGGVLLIVDYGLVGLKRLETGALVKAYEDQDKEVEHAVQMCLSEVSPEDPRYVERAAPPLSEEFPEGSKIFFLGEHAYGVAAQVSATTEKSLSVILAVGHFILLDSELH
jgi:5'-3' exoribonuclease 1